MTRYDLTERQSNLIRQRITEKTMAQIAEQNTLQGIIASIPDAPADAQFELKQDAGGSFYLDCILVTDRAQGAAAAMSESVVEVEDG